MVSKLLLLLKLSRRLRDALLVRTAHGHPCPDMRYITAEQHGQIMDGQGLSSNKSYNEWDGQGLYRSRWILVTRTRLTREQYTGWTKKGQFLCFLGHGNLFFFFITEMFSQKMMFYKVGRRDLMNNFVEHHIL